MVIRIQILVRRDIVRVLTDERVIDDGGMGTKNFKKYFRRKTPAIILADTQEMVVAEKIIDLSFELYQAFRARLGPAHPGHFAQHP